MSVNRRFMIFSLGALFAISGGAIATHHLGKELNQYRLGSTLLGGLGMGIGGNLIADSMHLYESD